MELVPVVSGLGIASNGEDIFVVLTKGESDDDREELFKFKLHKDSYKGFIMALIQLGKQLQEAEDIDLHI